MHELPDDDLILYYYGEAPNADAIRRRLDDSPRDRERYAELCRLFEQVDAQPVPEVADDYGARLWRQIQPRLHEPPPVRWREWLEATFAPRRLVMAGSLAVLLAVAFTAGRYWPTPAGSGVQELPAAGRARILQVAVREHLETSEMLLLELVNTPGASESDLREEPGRAEALLSANRLYRQAALRVGQRGLAEVLEALERLLIDLAHSDLSPDDLGDLRQRIEAGDLLFQIQIIGSHVRRDNPSTLPVSAGEA